MNNDDLQRRLAKLVALRDHPSTLPAIREQAARAYERLQGYAAEAPPGQFRRRQANAQLDPLLRHIMDELDRQTQAMPFPWWDIKPKR